MIPQDVMTRAVEVFEDSSGGERSPAGSVTRKALTASLEVLVHEGYIKIGPPTKVCPKCNGAKMTEGTIGYFACLGCGGRGRVSK